MENKDKIILDLCGGTGSWSRPYKEAGYDVRLITLPEHDVLTYEPPDGVYGILAAPPCTEFSVLNCKAEARERKPEIGMVAVTACPVSYTHLREGERGRAPHFGGQAKEAQP